MEAVWLLCLVAACHCTLEELMTFLSKNTTLVAIVLYLLEEFGLLQLLETFPKNIGACLSELVWSHSTIDTATKLDC
jgi:hypothetical protein